jgi:hypothetical protein
LFSLRGDPQRERFQIRIDDAVRDQRHARTLEIIGRRAEGSCRAG